GLVTLRASGVNAAISSSRRLNRTLTSQATIRVNAKYLRSVGSLCHPWAALYDHFKSSCSDFGRLFFRKYCEIESTNRFPKSASFRSPTPLMRANSAGVVG